MGRSSNQARKALTASYRHWGYMSIPAVRQTQYISIYEGTAPTEHSDTVIRTISRTFTSSNRDCIFGRVIGTCSMVYSECVKQRIVILHQTEGLKSPTIAKALRAEGISVSRVGVHKLLTCYEQTGRTSRRAGSGRLTKATESVHHRGANETK